MTEKQWAREYEGHFECEAPIRYTIMVRPECAEAAIKAKLLEHHDCTGQPPAYFWLGHGVPCRYIEDAVVAIGVPPA